MIGIPTRFWDFHYVGFGSASVAFGDYEVLLDVRGWEMICSPVTCGTEAWCWFLENDPELRNGRKGSPTDYSQQEKLRQRQAAIRDLQGALRSARWGRFVAFNPGGRYDRLRANLYLRPDGTGYFRGIYWNDWPQEKPVEFLWNPAELGLRETRAILTAPIVGHEARWEAFCRRLLDEQIAVVTREKLLDQPRRYRRGSEAELQRVTTWICHCHDDPDTLFAEGIAEVAYAAEMEGISAGLWDMNAYALSTPYAPGDWTDYRIESSYGSPPCPPRLQTLLNMAFQHNAFEGHVWRRRGGKPLEDCCRQADWVFRREACKITVSRPSAHERAESLLCLFDWLDGKVTLEQQRTLLGLDKE